MNNCANHKKEVAGITDMKLLAEMIGDLDYESLAELLFRLNLKLYRDGLKDRNAGRSRLGYALDNAAGNIERAAVNIRDVWQISKPFMNTDTLNIEK